MPVGDVAQMTHTVPLAPGIKVVRDFVSPPTPAADQEQRKPLADRGVQTAISAQQGQQVLARLQRADVKQILGRQTQAAECRLHLSGRQRT